MSVDWFRARKRFFVSVTFTLSVFLAAWALSPWAFFALNGTNSIDGTVFLIIKGKGVTKGELVAFQPPENRFYSDLWFVKYAAATSGDTVTFKNQVLYINGQPKGPVWQESTDGRLLFPGPEGVIPEGQFFAWTPHPRSFDSRYNDIGWISHEKVIGRAYRIF